MFHPSAYTVVLCAASAVSLCVSVIAWLRRGFPGGTAFALTMTAVVVWSLTSAAESAVTGFQEKELLAKLGYLGTANVAPFFFLFAYAYRDVSRRKLSPALALLWIIPVATIVLAFTNGSHFLIWSDLTPAHVPPTVPSAGHGAWYWIALYYDFFLVLAATVLLARVVLTPQKIFALQTAVLLASPIAPWAGVALYLSPINPFPGLDLPVIGFAITGPLVLFGISRLMLFDLVPVAHEALVEGLGDGLVVLDGQDRIVEMNAAARKAFGLGRAPLGRSVHEACPTLGTVVPRGASSPERAAEVMLAAPDLRNFDLRVSTLRGRRGTPEGRMIILRDITERKRSDLERERLITELSEALVDIKVLRGLLPICVHCRKVRDDSGYWHSIEQYVQEHSEAQFSHGLCDDCMRERYPEYLGEESGTKGK